ncbi:outer membrane protein [Algoriphagus boseongensis]|uniref:Outer membrane protein n=1 Tax=Algoriphagus boseongensis TaxID=1442587 RepID=A0A4R6T8X2_9BACT|nr:TolC family protein [Algoriphagus boseongensis]TDQ19176.1 outer membrane protein [Algoriphagus boseongensis]
MKKLFFLFMAIFGVLHTANSQEGIPPGPYDLQTCVEIALENNLTLKRTIANQQINEATLLQNQGQRIPSFNVGASSGFRWGRSINPVTNLFENNRIGNINLFANSSVTVFGGMRVNNSVAQARKDLESGEFSIQATTNQVTLDVINQFINVVFNREQVKIAENQLKSTTEQLQRTTKLVEAGSLPLSDQLDLQSQNATNQLEVINAKNSYRLAKLSLAQLMQIPFSDEFEVIEPGFEVTTFDLETNDPSRIYEIAIDLMPEIKVSEANLESAEYGVKIAKGAFLPTLGLSANVFSNYVDQPGFGQTEIPPFGDQIERNLSQSANLQLNIPIFTNFNNRASVQRARAQKILAEVDNTQAKNQLRQDIETAFNQALASEQSYEASLTRVKSLEETFRIAKQRFDLGAINSVDFQVAQNNLFNAQADLLNAKYTYIFRIKVLDFYLGNPINLN